MRPANCYWINKYLTRERKKKKTWWENTKEEAGKINKIMSQFPLRFIGFRGSSNGQSRTHTKENPQNKPLRVEYVSHFVLSFWRSQMQNMQIGCITKASCHVCASYKKWTRATIVASSSPSSLENTASTHISDYASTYYHNFCDSQVCFLQVKREEVESIACWITCNARWLYTEKHVIITVFLYIFVHIYDGRRCWRCWR